MWGTGTREWESQRWLVEAAWQILRGGTPQPFAAGTASGATAGIRRDYLSGRLDDLIRRMNPVQRLRFRQALMRQFLRHIPSIRSRDKGLARAWRTLRAAAHEWSHMHSPDDTALRAAAEVLDGVLTGLERAPTLTDPGGLNPTLRRMQHSAEVIVLSTGWEPDKTAQRVAQELVN